MLWKNNKVEIILIDAVTDHYTAAVYRPVQLYESSRDLLSSDPSYADYHSTAPSATHKWYHFINEHQQIVNLLQY